MTFFKKPPHYYTLLLTLWEERSHNLANTAVWRFRLEDPRTSERRGFSTLAELTAFLADQMRSGNKTEERPTQPLDLRPSG